MATALRPLLLPLLRRRPQVCIPVAEGLLRPFPRAAQAGGRTAACPQTRWFSNSSSSNNDDGGGDKKRRRRLRFEAAGGPGGEGPSLQAFIRRAQVLALYRSFMRHARRLDRPELRKDILTQARDGFRLHRAVDATVVPSLLVEANRHLDMLKSMAGGPAAPPQRRSSLASSSSSPSLFGAPNLWMVQGIIREGEEEEESKVGEGWPWERDDEEGGGEGGGSKG